MVVQSRPPSGPAIRRLFGCRQHSINAPAIYPRVQAVYSSFWGVVWDLMSVCPYVSLMGACGTACNAMPKPAT